MNSSMAIDSSGGKQDQITIPSTLQPRPLFSDNERHAFMPKSILSAKLFKIDAVWQWHDEFATYDRMKSTRL